MKAFNKSKRINPLDRYRVCIITYENCEQWYIPLKHVRYSVSEGCITSLAMNLAKVITRTGFTPTHEDTNSEYRRVVKGGVLPVLSLLR